MGSQRVRHDFVIEHSRLWKCELTVIFFPQLDSSFTVLAVILPSLRLWVFSKLLEDKIFLPFFFLSVGLRRAVPRPQAPDEHWSLAGWGLTGTVGGRG